MPSNTMIINGMKVHFIHTTKFKTMGISLKLVNEFQKDTVNYRAILPQVLTRSTEKYPSNAILQQHIDSIYGMSFDASTQKIGCQSVMSFDIQVVNELYISESISLSQMALALLKEVLFHPRRTNQMQFYHHEVEHEKRMLKEEIEADYHDKFEYAFMKFKEAMFQGELYEHSARGIYESIDEVTSKDLYHYYLECLQNDQAFLYLIGDFDEAEMIQTIQSLFSFQPQSKNWIWLDKEPNHKPQVVSIKEIGNVQQTRINIGYRTSIFTDHPLYYPMLLFNLVLGEMDQSILFQTIREKHQLSYYVSSMYQPNKGYVCLFAGCDKQAEQQVIHLMKTLMDEVLQNGFTEELLFLAKENLIYRIKQHQDSEQTLINRAFFYTELFHKPYQADEIILQVKDVTLAQVIEAGKTLVLDTVHIYTSEGGQDE